MDADMCATWHSLIGPPFCHVTNPGQAVIFLSPPLKTYVITLKTFAADWDLGWKSLLMIRWIGKRIISPLRFLASELARITVICPLRWYGCMKIVRARGILKKTSDTTTKEDSSSYAPYGHTLKRGARVCEGKGLCSYAGLKGVTCIRWRVSRASGWLKIKPSIMCKRLSRLCQGIMTASG